MSRSLLLAHLPRLGNGPPAVQRLRRFALDLAVRGQLSTAPTHGDSVERLIRDIDRTRERAWLAPKLAALALRPVAIEDQPFAVPGDWAWTRLGRIATYIQRGKSPTYAVDRGLPVVSQKCVRWEGLDLVPARMITEESLGKYMAERFLREGDLLWNSTGTGTIGRVAVALDPPDRLVCDGHVTVVRCSQVDPRYIQLWLRSDHVFGRIEDDASGATNQVELTLQMAVSQVVPLPPIEEQHRIVDMVADLFVLCDELDTNRVKREGTRDRLRAASLARLTAPETTPGKVTQEDVAFFLSHSDRMVTKPEHVADLRRSILRCAVQGLLTTRTSPGTRTAELLAGVDAERADVARGDRRATPSRQVILAPDLMWTVPEHWSWRALADLALFIDYRGKTPEKMSAGVRLVTAKNVRPGKINAEPREFVSEGEYFKWMTRGIPRQGDILFTTEAPMGNAAVVDTDERFALAQRIIDLRVYGKITPAFVSLILNAEPFQRVLDATATGLTAKGIKSAKLRRLPVPIPAVDEQLSIVAKVDDLMKVCDELERALWAADEGRAKLLEAVLHEALNGRVVGAELAEATV